jgi:disulfide bond formation protein DsbB
MTSSDVIEAAAKASPPVAYVGVRLVGVSLPDWVAIATLAYLLLQGAHLIWRWRRQARRGGD